jgi:Fe-S cluster assembly iron-binding protein IscA
MNGNWWPPGCESVEYKMKFKRNLKDGSIDNDKAKLVVEGYKQKKGMDDHETYSLEYYKLKS